MRLGGEVQTLMRLMEERQRLEVELERRPTMAEWSRAVNHTIPSLKRQIHTSQRAKADMIKANVRLVVSIVKQMVKSYQHTVNFADACQDGILGLSKACDKFDPMKGFRFSTYVNWWIKKEVRDSVRSQQSSIRIPHHARLKMNAIRIAEVTLREQLNRIPANKL